MDDKLEEIYKKWIIKIGFNQSEMLPKENAIKALKEAYQLGFNDGYQEANNLQE